MAEDIFLCVGMSALGLGGTLAECTKHSLYKPKILYLQS